MTPEHVYKLFTMSNTPSSRSITMTMTIISTIASVTIAITLIYGAFAVSVTFGWVAGVLLGLGIAKNIIGLITLMVLVFSKTEAA